MGTSERIGPTEVSSIESVAGSSPHCSFQERQFTIFETAVMWNLSVEFIREIVTDEQGVTEWVRQAPGRRRYRVLRVPQSVLERLYRRASERHQADRLASGSCAIRRPK
jgi:hypothetical protein